MTGKTLLCIVFMCMLSTAVFSSVCAGRVTGVTDGSNITVRINGQDMQVRFYCVDAPQPGQRFGHEAKEHVTGLLLGKEARVEVMDRDHSNRLISRVTVDGRDISTELVKAGLAWYDGRRSHDPALAAAHRIARTAGIGIWSEHEPEAPWVFRRKSRGISPDFSVGHYGASPTSSLPITAGNPPARRDYGFVPVSDQTCESSFGISIFTVPALWPCYSQWGYGGFYGGMYGASYGGLYGISFGNTGGGFYMTTTAAIPGNYGGGCQPSRPCSYGSYCRPSWGTWSPSTGCGGRPPSGSGSFHHGSHHR